uniref:Uncharacterized protein AlNc14C25G2524 n=1 Tax=Albugo laibachii Nc14 TaxID=890382 RepID=F0W6N6_9STRA|nr:conserved hypothetical protein [Albugo laibachii Nc14]|eukprot:CCA16781.1 conserved hypothetical protein [Albugo laibachii Nc14]
MENEAQREYMYHLLKLAAVQDFDPTNSTDKDAHAVCTATNQVIRDEYSAFESYFVRIWDSCRDQWCSYTLQNVITLFNNTNNRLEASWKKHLNETVDSLMTVYECIAFIMYYQSMMKTEYNYRLHKLYVVRNAAYDTEMDRVLNLVGENVCSPIYNEYIFAVTSANYQFYDGVAKMFFINNVSADEVSRDEPNVEYTDALSALADVEFVFNKRCLQDLVRALKSIESTSDASVEIITQKTLSANPEAELFDSHTEEDDHKERYRDNSSTIEIVDDVSSENAPATASRDGDDPLEGIEKRSDLRTEKLPAEPRAAIVDAEGSKGEEPHQSGSRTGCSDDASGMAEFCECPKDSKRRREVPTGGRNASKVQYSLNPKDHQDAKCVQCDYRTSHRALLRFSNIVQALPKTMLTKCRTQVLKLQDKNADLAENQAAVDFPGIRIRTPLSLGWLDLMNGWYKAVVVIEQVNAVEQWLKIFDGELMIGLSDHFQVERRIDLVDQLREFDLMSYEIRSLWIIS